MLPPDMFQWVAGGMGVMGLLRTGPALRNWQRFQYLPGQKFWKISFKEIRPTLERAIANNQLWLGKGFVWDQRHTQMSTEILRRGLDSTILGRPDKGAGWLHGIGMGEEDIYLPLDDTFGHMLLGGTTRAGKTVMLRSLVTQAVMRNEAVIIIDPKGDKDLLEVARQACEMVGRPDRFAYFHPAFPENSIRLNPLANCNRWSELASRVAALRPTEAGSDVFQAFSQMALNNVIQGLRVTGRHATLTEIRTHLEGGVEKLLVAVLENHFDMAFKGDRNAWQPAASQYVAKVDGKVKEPNERKAKGYSKFYRERVQAISPSPDLEGLITMDEHDRSHFSKMVAGLLPILSQLTTGDLGRLLSPDPSDAADNRPILDSGALIRRRMVTYIGLDSLSDAIVGSTIGSLILADLAAVAGDRYNSEDARSRCSSTKPTRWSMAPSCRSSTRVVAPSSASASLPRPSATSRPAPGRQPRRARSSATPTPRLDCGWSTA